MRNLNTRELQYRFLYISKKTIDNLANRQQFI